ncbi:MAG: YlxR family protein [Clostridia bacterium]|nr:YlxR family protein [Clostridia bacterium]
MKPKGSFFRTCTGCGEIKNKFELLRIVRLPDGNVVFDKSGKLSGRGAYVCNDAKCIEKALKTGKLSRTLKTDIPKGILDDYGKQ